MTMVEMSKSTTPASANGNGIKFKSRATNANDGSHSLSFQPQQKPPRSGSIITSKKTSKSDNQRFLKIATIVFIIAIADVIFVWRTIDASIGGEDDEPHHVGAEAGLHHLHEKKRMKQLNDHVQNNGVIEKKKSQIQSQLYKGKEQRVITVNTDGDIVDNAHNTPFKGSHETKSDQIDERIANLLKFAHIEVDEETASQLPTWDNIIAQYGEIPRVYGLETCKPYRETIPPEDRMIGPAGTFNSGTNLLFKLLKENCDIKEARNSNRSDEIKRNGVRWQAPWGKHNPPRTHRFKNKAKMWGEGINHTAFFPVVMIKDPYSWMGSQCRHKYTTNWEHGEGNCPNLINKHNLDRDVPVPVHVNYPIGRGAYESLIDMWNTWYLDYEQQTFPMLRMRYEDLLFHGEEVSKIACDCVGGVFTKHFTYIEGSAKENGFSVHNGANGLVKALLQYGDPEKRLEGLTDRDRWYASRSLSPELMQKYGYVAPPLPT